jgi:AcrR family transcriptional regulator
MDRIEHPHNERSRRTRAAVLDATWRLLEEEGASSVTMASVAARAGVSRRAIYLHFASRGDLLLALHEHVDRVLDLEASVRPVREAPDGVALLRELAAHLARYHPRILRIDRALEAARRSDADVARLWDQGLQVWHDGCREIARRLSDEDRLAPPFTVETAADLLVALMRHDLLESLIVDRGWSPERYRDTLAEIMIRMLVRDAGQETSA